MNSECGGDRPSLTVPASDLVYPEIFPPFTGDGLITVSPSSSRHCSADRPVAPALGKCVITCEADSTTSLDNSGDILLGTSSNSKARPGSISSTGTSRYESTSSSFTSSHNNNGHSKLLVAAAAGRISGTEQSSSQLNMGDLSDGGTIRHDKTMTDRSVSNEAGSLTVVTKTTDCDVKQESNGNVCLSNNGKISSNSNNRRIRPGRLGDSINNIDSDTNDACISANTTDACVNKTRKESIFDLRNSDQDREEPTEMEDSLLCSDVSSSCCLSPTESTITTTRSAASSSVAQLPQPQRTGFAVGISSPRRSSRTRATANSGVHKDDVRDATEDVMFSGNKEWTINIRETNGSACFCCGRRGDLLRCERCLKMYHIDCLATAGHVACGRSDKAWICPQCPGRAAASKTRNIVGSECRCDDGSSDDDVSDISRSDNTSQGSSNSTGVCINAGTSPCSGVLQERGLEGRQHGDMRRAIDPDAPILSTQFEATTCLRGEVDDEANAGIEAGGDTATRTSMVMSATADAEAATTTIHRETEPEIEAGAVVGAGETAATEKRIIATKEEWGVWRTKETAAAERQQQEQDKSRENAPKAFLPSPSPKVGEDVPKQGRELSANGAAAQPVLDPVDGATETGTDTLSTPKLAAAAAGDGAEGVVTGALSALHEGFPSSPALSSVSQETLRLQQDEDLLLQLEDQQKPLDREEEPYEGDHPQQKAEEMETHLEGGQREEDDNDAHVETRQLLEESPPEQDEKPLRGENDVLNPKEQQLHGAVFSTKRGEECLGAVGSPSTAVPSSRHLRGMVNRLQIMSAAAAVAPAAVGDVAGPAAAAEAVNSAAAAPRIVTPASRYVAAPAAGPSLASGGGFSSNERATGGAAGVARQTGTTSAMCGSSSSNSFLASEKATGCTPTPKAAGSRAAVEATLQLTSGDSNAAVAVGPTCLSSARKRRRRGDEQRINVGPEYQQPWGGGSCDCMLTRACPGVTGAAASRGPFPVSTSGGEPSFSLSSSSLYVSSSTSPFEFDGDSLPAYPPCRNNWYGDRDECFWEEGVRPFYLKQRHTNADLQHPSLEPRLVYSPHCMETRRQLCAALQRNSDSITNTGDNHPCVCTHQELAKFVEDCAKNWKARPGWQPYSPEFAYKLLHRADYNPQRALNMLDDPGFSFIDMCDPPMRKYENKWKRRDKRGTYPPSPYPPPVVIRAYLQERIRTMRHR